MINEKKEILETIWKSKWNIQPHTKVWWIKMINEFFDLGFQEGSKQTLKDELEKELRFLYYLENSGDVFTDIDKRKDEIEKELGVGEK
jgi:hypothetical protein